MPNRLQLIEEIRTTVTQSLTAAILTDQVRSNILAHLDEWNEEQLMGLRELLNRDVFSEVLESVLEHAVQTDDQEELRQLDQFLDKMTRRVDRLETKMDGWEELSNIGKELGWHQP